MLREYMAPAELVSHLEGRGVRIDMDAELAIRRYGYYSIVNGYKGPFLDRRAMQSSDGDVYEEGVAFSQIFNLFSFDMDLRSAVLPYLISAESIIRNSVVNAFCGRNRGISDYLERSNYVDAQWMLFPKSFKGDRRREHSRNLGKLMALLNGKQTVRKGTPGYIRHSIEAYGEVPLWVLQNDLTFGNIEHFYQLQKRGVQNDACKAIESIARNGRRIEPQGLLRDISILVDYRNICAHGDRLYCASPNGARFADMVKSLTLVIARDDVRDLVAGMNEVMAGHAPSMPEKVQMDVARGMGATVRRKGE